MRIAQNDIQYVEDLRTFRNKTRVLSYILCISGIGLFLFPPLFFLFAYIIIFYFFIFLSRYYKIIFVDQKRVRIAINSAQLGLFVILFAIGLFSDSLFIIVYFNLNLYYFIIIPIEIILIFVGFDQLYVKNKSPLSRKLINAMVFPIFGGFLAIFKYDPELICSFSLISSFYPCLFIFLICVPILFFISFGKCCELLTDSLISSIQSQIMNKME